MSLYRKALIAASSVLLKSFCRAPTVFESRNIHRWVAPTLKELRSRRKKLDPAPPEPRSSFSEFNYEAEVFAFGKRVGENFDRDILKQALTHKSYVNIEEDKAKEQGIEFKEIPHNKNLIKSGDEVISHFLSEEFSQKFPKDVVKALVEHLSGEEMLAHVAKHMGLTDIILTPEFPVEKNTMANTFKAVVAALKHSQDLQRAQLFIKDFLISQLNGKNISDIWAPKDPFDYLLRLLEEKEINGREVEPRLCNQSATNTILANYQVGLYHQKQLLGIGWGESIQTAKETAALDAIHRIYKT